MFTSLWLKIGSLTVCTILAVIFIVGGFFETRRLLRKMKQAENAVSPDKQQVE